MAEQSNPAEASPSRRQLGDTQLVWNIVRALLVGPAVLLCLLIAYESDILSELPAYPATVAAFLIVVVVPGAVLQAVLLKGGDFGLPERLAIALPLGLGVAAIPGLIVLERHTDLQEFAILHAVFATSACGLSMFFWRSEGQDEPRKESGGPGRFLLVGILLAQLVNGLVRGAAESVGLEYSAGLGRIAQGLVIIIIISVAIGQLEVKTELLNYVIAIALISIGLAVALAFGLGSRELVSQILAGIYVRELYEVGQRVRIEELEGSIEEIGTAKTLLLTDEGELISVANRVLLEQRVGSR